LVLSIHSAETTVMMIKKTTILCCKEFFTA